MCVCERERERNNNVGGLMGGFVSSGRTCSLPEDTHHKEYNSEERDFHYQ